jgi:hypothetical protein
LRSCVGSDSADRRTAPAHRLFCDIVEYAASQLLDEEEGLYVGTTDGGVRRSRVGKAEFTLAMA